MLTEVEGDRIGRLQQQLNVKISGNIEAMNQKIYLSDEAIPTALQETLNQIAAKAIDRKDEVVEVLSGEQPAKSRFVDSEYVACTWWEGCYYCQDDDKNWHRVKCFA